MFFYSILQYASDLDTDFIVVYLRSPVPSLDSFVCRMSPAEQRPVGVWYPHCQRGKMRFYIIVIYICNCRPLRMEGSELSVCSPTRSPGSRQVRGNPV